MFFKKFNSAGKFPDGRVKLDVYFEDSRGGQYVWTPDWNATRSFFLEASRIEQLNVPSGPETNRFKDVAAKVYEESKASPANLKLWALDLANRVRAGASLQ